MSTSGTTGVDSNRQSGPVRPRPVWISSKISAAPTRSQASRAATRTSSGTGVHAALAADRLDQHGRGALGDGGGDALDGRLGDDEAGDERRERRLLGLLRRRRERAEGAAVEALAHDDEVAGAASRGARA